VDTNFVIRATSVKGLEEDFHDVVVQAHRNVGEDTSRDELRDEVDDAQTAIDDAQSSVSNADDALNTLRRAIDDMPDTPFDVDDVAAEIASSLISRCLTIEESNKEFFLNGLLLSENGALADDAWLRERISRAFKAWAEKVADFKSYDPMLDLWKEITEKLSAVEAYDATATEVHATAIEGNGGE